MTQPTLAFGGSAQRELFGLDAGPVHWPSLTEAEAADETARLTDWVRALVRRFSIEPRVVPPCWGRHPGMVEALSALRDHERGAYAETAPPGAAVDFFRAFREIEHYLAELAAKTQCSAGAHRQPMLQDWAHTQPPEAGAEAHA